MGGVRDNLITFIDDYSQKTWVQFLQEKLEALKSFKARVENEKKKKKR